MCVFCIWMFVCVCLLCVVCCVCVCSLPMKRMNTQVKAMEIFAALQDGHTLQPPGEGKDKKKICRMCSVSFQI
jgi:hypothetical protein